MKKILIGVILLSSISSYASTVTINGRVSCEGEMNQSLVEKILNEIGSNTEISVLRNETIRHLGKSCNRPVYTLKYKSCTAKRSLFSDETTYQLKLTMKLENLLAKEEFTPISQNGLSLGFNFVGEYDMEMVEDSSYPLLIDDTVLAEDSDSIKCE